MKLVVSSSELLKGILTVSKAIPAKAVEAILEDYLFVLKGNILEITASDMEITLKTEIEVENTEEEGRIAVPARQITDLLKNFRISLLQSAQKARTLLSVHGQAVLQPYLISILTTIL